MTCPVLQWTSLLLNNVVWFFNAASWLSVRETASKGACSGHMTGLSNLFGVVVHHAGGVVHSQTDLVFPFAGLGPPQPDLVFTELTGDVGDHLPHVQTLPSAVVPSVEHGNITHTHLTTTDTFC